jgi:polysaccharide biosynthesis/export protein
MKFFRILLLLLISVYLFSCKSTQKLPNYVEDLNVTDTTGKGDVTYTELRIQKNDLLSIQIYSLATKREADELYNLSTTAAGVTSGSNTASTTGFLVDMNGNIEHPRLGTIHAEGLTKQELANEIKQRLTVPVELLKDPTVIIRLLNFRVTILGEVGSPGSITVPGEKITILEAIGLAGDFTMHGRKNTLKITREINGKRQHGTIDLSSKSLYDSPYYNLVQNDVVFVEPSKHKAKMVEQQVVTQRITMALSLITAAAFIYNIFK